MCIDLSSTCTGWALFDIENKALLEFGKIKSSKGKGEAYPWAPLIRIEDIVHSLMSIILDVRPETIVIEEVNQGKNRLGQKTLCGAHWVLLSYLKANEIFEVTYVDSDGKHGWRSANGLGLQLSSTDKLKNAEIRKFNKKLSKGNKKKRIISQKTLACKKINKLYNLNLNESVSGDADIADAIGIGTYVLFCNNGGNQ